MKRVALIGYGAIGRSIAAKMLLDNSGPARLVAIQMREYQLARGRLEVPPEVLATSRIEETLGAAPDIVIEAASHEAVAQWGPAVLGHGCELFVLSTGALAADELRETLFAQAQRSGGYLSIPCGALAGFDGLRSLREAGLTQVSYRSTKPPAAWRGTEAETVCDLDSLQESRVIFRGSAREAARRFPRNANLAVAVALAGVGLDTTEVQLIADPRARGNSGHLVARTENAVLDVELTGMAFDSNPKTSEITGLSVVAALTNGSGFIRYK
jgi:aspartate dehydrogenase